MQRRDVLRHIGIVAFLSVCVSVLLNILLLQTNLPEYSERYQEASVLLYSPPFWQQLLTSGLLIPIVEELVFRGIGFRMLRRWISFTWAMLISAVVFGAYHGNLVQFVYAAICGVLLAYLCEKYDSMIAPIVSHMAMNIAAIVLTQWGVFAQVLKSGMVSLVVIVFCGVCVAIALVKLQKMDVTKVLKIYCKE